MPILPFQFKLNTDLRFGVGALARLPEWLEQAGWRRLALVIDGGVSRHPRWQAMATELQQRFTIVAQLETNVTEPTYDYLDEIRTRFMGRPIDAFIAIGGGSVLDLAKALSLLVTNELPAIQYRGFDLPQVPGPPLVVIPTTAGTGSEVTPNAVLTDSREQRKFGINTTLYLPRFCLLDPELTQSCPRSVTVSSGMDALVHTHESFVSRKATPISRMYSLEAFGLIFNSLATAVEEPDDLDARSQMLLGSYLAGTALFNSSAGPAGALSYPLGVHYKVPHGLAGAVFLPHIVQHNVDRGYGQYKELYDRIQGAEAVHDPVEASRRFCARLWELCRRIGVPSSLEQFAFRRADLDSFLEQAQKLQAAFEMNPVPFGVEDAKRILDQMTEGLAVQKA